MKHSIRFGLSDVLTNTGNISFHDWNRFNPFHSSKAQGVLHIDSHNNISGCVSVTPKDTTRNYYAGIRGMRKLQQSKLPKLEYFGFQASRQKLYLLIDSRHEDFSQFFQIHRWCYGYKDELKTKGFFDGIWSYIHNNHVDTLLRKEQGEQFFEEIKKAKLPHTYLIHSMSIKEDDKSTTLHKESTNPTNNKKPLLV